MPDRLHLQVFLYILLRDHLPAGVVEEILVRHVDILDQLKDDDVRHGLLGRFSNPHLAAYAAHLAERLTP